MRYSVKLKYTTGIFVLCNFMSLLLVAQDWKLTPENILDAYSEASENLQADPLRPAFHLTPPAGCMGDPNGGIYHQDWYHIFYGHQPFGPYPGGWFWAHARSRDLLHWEHLPPELTPAFDLGLTHVGSGSTIINGQGKPLAFYSASMDNEPMKFWQAQFNDNLVDWEHNVTDPVLTLDAPGIPDFDRFWRDPFVFKTGGRTFLIACADLFEKDFVPVPIFEAVNNELTSWEYRGILFTVPKHKYRNLEVPELRPIGNKWIFMASTDAPVDRVNYFIGDFDTKNLKFIPETEGVVDYSGHYYAQETILDNKGDLYLMAWMPGWDRDWLPTYMNEPLKNSSPLWNGCFALPRKLYLDKSGTLIQQPVEGLKQLRGRHFTLAPKDLPVTSAFSAVDVLENIRGDQLEISLVLDLHAASFCGLNVLCNEEGNGGLYITWSGDIINVDGIKVPVKDWKAGKTLKMNIFIDKKFVEIFIDDGRYCVTRQVRAEHIKGDHIALTRLGGTARLVSLEAWVMQPINFTQKN